MKFYCQPQNSLQSLALYVDGNGEVLKLSKTHQLCSMTHGDTQRRHLALKLEGYGRLKISL